MQEIWKDIKGYEGLYQVSNFGRIKSLKRLKENHSKIQIVPEKIKSARKHTAGYLVTDLYKNNIQQTRYIHRLVAEAFIPNPEKKEQINHIDGNKQNNKVENLEWCTNQENQIHSWKMGLHNPICSLKAIQAMNKANSKKVKCIETNTIYNSIAEAGRHCNISGSLITKVCKGKGKTAGKGTRGEMLHWEYV